MFVETNQGNELELNEKVIEGSNDETYDVVQPPEGWVGIAGAADLSGYRKQYVRSLVLDGKVEAVKIARKGYAKWFVNPESIDEYKKSTKGTRGGLRRFILRMSLEDEDAAREALDAVEGLEYSLELQYQPKSDDDADSEESDVEDSPSAGEETLDFLE